MTREDIIAQAKVGGTAVVRLPIKEVQSHESYLFPLVVCGQYDNHGLAVNCDNVISIEPAPKPLEEQLADALAEIERLNGLLAIDPPQEKPWVPERLEGYGPWIEGRAGDTKPIGRYLVRHPVTGHLSMFDFDVEFPDYMQIVAHCLKEDPNPWRDHESDEMPCDGDLVVDVQYYDNIELQYKKAESAVWTAVKRWRPHVEVG